MCWSYLPPEELRLQDFLADAAFSPAVDGGEDGHVLGGEGVGEENHDVDGWVAEVDELEAAGVAVASVVGALEDASRVSNVIP